MTSTASHPIWIYDTTLRDGAQREGISLSLEDKLRIARQLDELGIPFIEGGWPGANPKDVQFFWKLKEEPLKQAEVVAFCSTRRPNMSAAEDRMLQAILAAGTRWVTIFGKSWDLHVTEGLKTSLEENLAMIRDTIEYLRSQGRRVIYDAEHWFDGYKANRDYALKTLKAAKDAGAEWLVLCDTNGGTLPDQVSQIVRDVAKELNVKRLNVESELNVRRLNVAKELKVGRLNVEGSNLEPANLQPANLQPGTDTNLQPATETNLQPANLQPATETNLPYGNAKGEQPANLQPMLGIHTHNDSDTAVANALAAVSEGACMVQGTINGYGERCGNANLCSVIPNLQLKLGLRCIEDNQLARLTQASRLISEIVNLAPNDHAAFVGRSAFAHKGGIHVSAVAKNPLTYEHIQPEQIGNQRRIVISDQSGLSNVLAKARSFGHDLDKKDPACREILERLKDLENEGYQFEAAEASFDLLMRDALGYREHPFELKGCQIHSDMLQGVSKPYSNSVATIKVSVNNQEILEVAEGNGPVSALDAALRKALVKFYPEIADFHLTDYKVRILDGTAGTSAKTRVLVESSNGEERWTTVGVSSNILEASYEAVVEGIEYGLLLESSAKTPLSHSPALKER
ncbi:MULTISPECIES: citramalate synthase [unclassified Moorena]|uniref:citramalate synthase n=1 Tax=unclassified Moorena TaxID=2683338 RepID=UPI00140173EB|nr:MULTISPECIES: citramalate synthase [unclassified Moorena]NEO16785.1 citramalate synthase [Moorena sp. SIO3E8]NEQ03363.1 citramalate synthase [Moorena sp. SIO3F7]